MLRVAVGILRAGDVNRHAVGHHVGVGNVIGRREGRIARAPDAARRVNVLATSGAKVSVGSTPASIASLNITVTVKVPAPVSRR